MSVTGEASHTSAKATPDFDEVYRSHVTYVWNTLHRLRVPRSDVEDLAHDVFVVAYRKLDTFDPERPMRPWLFGIAYRVVAAHRRKARTTCVEDPHTIPDTAALPSRRAAERDLVLAGLGELPIDQRAVVILHDLDGYTAGEIAQSLDCSINTVYSRLRLGRAKFVLAVRRRREEIQ